MPLRVAAAAVRFVVREAHVAFRLRSSLHATIILTLALVIARLATVLHFTAELQSASYFKEMRIYLHCGRALSVYLEPYQRELTSQLAFT